MGRIVFPGRAGRGFQAGAHGVVAALGGVPVGTVGGDAHASAVASERGGFQARAPFGRRGGPGMPVWRPAVRDGGGHGSGGVAGVPAVGCGGHGNGDRAGGVLGCVPGQSRACRGLAVVPSGHGHVAAGAGRDGCPCGGAGRDTGGAAAHARRGAEAVVAGTCGALADAVGRGVAGRRGVGHGRVALVGAPRVRARADQERQDRAWWSRPWSRLPGSAWRRRRGRT